MVSAVQVATFPFAGRTLRIIFQKETAKFANTKLRSVSIQTSLLQEARRLGGHQSNTAATSAAMEHYIRYLKQLQILELAGAIDIDPEYDYKELWRRETEELDE